MSSGTGGYDERADLAGIYDTVYGRIGPRDIDFFIDYSRNSPDGTLELACGTGRVMLPVAQAGCRITGLDLSTGMLHQCRLKLENQPDSVRRLVSLVQADMTDFSTGQLYSLVTIPFRSFQLIIDTEKQKSCLRSIHRHLKHGGLLIIDVFKPRFSRLEPSPGYAEEIGDLPETPLPDGGTIRRTNRTVAWHQAEQYNEIELKHYLTGPDGVVRTITQLLKMHYFFRYEMEHLLELCGFRVRDIFGDFDRSPLEDDSREMIFVAEKA